MVSAILRVAIHDVPAAGAAVGARALRPAAQAVTISRALERDLRERIGDSLGRASLAFVDGALASPYADAAVQRVLESGLAERSIALALSSDLVDVVARELVRAEVVERVADGMLAGGVVDRALDRAEAAGVPEQVADRLLADGVAEHVVSRLLDGPELERIVEAALDNPGVERLVAQIVRSRLLEETVAQVIDGAVVALPESAAMWSLIDVIAQSPAVTEAITQQGAGFADQVAGEMRKRSRDVDARLERGARRLFRRRRATESPGEAPPAPGTT